MSVRISCDSYDLLSFGPFPPSGIRFMYDQHDRIPLDRALVAEKDAIIARQRRLCRRAEILPLCRYRSHAVSRGGVVFRVGHTDFGEYLLSDISHPEWNSGSLRALMSHPLSIAAVTITRDGRLLMGYRGSRVASDPGRLQAIPGGYLHPPGSIATAARQELEEEIAVRPHEVAGLEVTGFAQVLPSGKPEILLAIRLAVPADVVLRRRGADAWEFERFRTIPGSEDSITGLLRQEGALLAPASHAALVSFSIRHFGIRSVAGMFPVGIREAGP